MHATITQALDPRSGLNVIPVSADGTANESGPTPRPSRVDAHPAHALEHQRLLVSHGNPQGVGRAANLVTASLLWMCFQTGEVPRPATALGDKRQWSKSRPGSSIHYRRGELGPKSARKQITSYHSSRLLCALLRRIIPFLCARVDSVFIRGVVQMAVCVHARRHCAPRCVGPSASGGWPGTTPGVRGLVTH